MAKGEFNYSVTHGNYMWPLQHSGLRVAKLQTWQLSAPRVNALMHKEETSWPFMISLENHRMSLLPNLLFEAVKEPIQIQGKGI